jgi:hypothetical protein
MALRMFAMDMGLSKQAYDKEVEEDAAYDG